MAENERIKTHVKNRDAIVLCLKEACLWYKNPRTNDSDYLVSNASKEEVDSPILQCLQAELNLRNTNEHPENDYVTTNRCTDTFVSENLRETERERISDYMTDYEDDLIFLQAVVWLKSAIPSRKDIPKEQLRFAFHRLWTIDSVENTGTTIDKSPESLKEFSVVEDEDFVSRFLNLTRESSIEELTERSNLLRFNSDATSISGVDLLCNGLHDEGEISSLIRGMQTTRKKDETVIPSKNSPCFSEEPSTPRRHEASTRNRSSKRRHVIPDSDEEAFSSDMFDSDEESQVTCYTPQRRVDPDEQRIYSVLTKSVKNFGLSQDIDILENNIFFTEKNSEKSGTFVPCLDSSEGTATPDLSFLKEISKNERETRYLRENKNENEMVLPTQESKQMIPASKFDTGYSSGFFEDVIVSETERIENDPLQNRKNFTTKSSIRNTGTTIINCTKQRTIEVSGNVNEQSQLQSPVLCRRRKRTVIADDHDFIRRNYEKKKKLCSDLNISLEETVKRESMMRRSISSHWLKFNLDLMNTDEVALESVKMILSYFESEKLGREFTRKQLWKSTLEKEAIETVLSFCDVFETEKRTNACTREIVKTVTTVLGNLTRSTRLNENVHSAHHISVILQLCNSVRICGQVMDYLTDRLKFYEDILTSARRNNEIDVHVMIDQLHLLFYALSIALEKYGEISSSKRHLDKLQELEATSVVDLWKKQFCDSHGVREETTDLKEKRWLEIFDDFTSIALDDFVEFAKKSYTLRKKLLTCRDK